MNDPLWDLDLLAAARRPIPGQTTETKQGTGFGVNDAPSMCRDILLAIPAEDYDLRARVTEFFDRIMVVTGKHTVDCSLLYAYKETPKELEAHIERGQREECAIVVAKYVVQAWKDIQVDGHRMRELTTQAVVVKPRPVRG
jgi:hypothetical protein